VGLIENLASGRPTLGVANAKTDRMKIMKRFLKEMGN